MDELSRRDVLGATAAASLGSLAGCLGQLVDDSEDDQGSNGNGNGDRNGNGTGNGDDDGTENGDGSEGPGGNGNDDDEADRPPEGVTSLSIETTSADCGSSDDATAHAESTDGGVQITGALTAPDPCHGAVIDRSATELSGSTLSVTVDVDDTSEEGCMDCVGLIEYEIQAELEDGTEVDSVNVDHTTGGGYGIAWESSEAGVSPPAIESSSIETVDAGCASGDSDSASAEVADDTVTVDGVLTASNPCHEAILARESIEESALNISVDVESTLGEGEMCQDCLGAIDYEATVDVEDGSKLDAVHVSHVDGETHTIELSSN